MPVSSTIHEEETFALKKGYIGIAYLTSSWGVLPSCVLVLCTLTCLIPGLFFGLYEYPLALLPSTPAMGLASFRVSLFGFLVASFIIQGLEALSCPSKWFLYKDHCYGFFKNELSWQDAEVAFLVAITSTRRISELQALSTREDLCVFHQDRVMLRLAPSFIPKTECQQYGQYAHLASVTSMMEQEMIASHIANNHITKKGVWIGLYDSCMMWLASFRVSLFGFLVASFIIQGLEAISCPRHWFMFENFCYGFFQEELSWYDAEARFRWVDESAKEYFPWTPKQPSKCKKKQNCVELYADEYRRWNNRVCEVEQPYLCKTNF
ncbi:uncharacterized protein LOC116511202 [Thamnophis elegans]|uniref:uncharacterized protein LOC116511202 n=1 Tax=Thamnophis elegans TaxID=35005 RepID=UPI0013769319|nr:uncharacterized protein LOC116511202 [Thamnophis elegans]